MYFHGKTSEEYRKKRFKSIGCIFSEMPATPALKSRFLGNRAQSFGAPEVAMYKRFMIAALSVLTPYEL